MTVHAFVRDLPSCFSHAISKYFTDGVIDCDLAKRQHARYIEALKDFNVTPVPLTPAQDYPDSVFVEDIVMVFGDHAILGRSGMASRRGEVNGVAPTLKRHISRVSRIDAPNAFIDGGDVLQHGKSVYVGRSSRTNDAGIQQLRHLLHDDGFRVYAVDVMCHTLHLKTVASFVGDTLIMTEGAFDLTPFRAKRELDIIEIPHQYTYWSNVLDTHLGGVIVAQGYAPIVNILHARGYEVCAIDCSEIRKADGSLTCMSTLFGYHHARQNHYEPASQWHASSSQELIIS